MKFIGQQTTLEDLVSDPQGYGLPTFEQFCKNASAYRNDPGDDTMAALELGPNIGRKDLKKIKYKVHGKDVKADHLEKVLSDYNHTLADLDDVIRNRNSRLKKKIEMVPLGGGKFDVVIDLLP